MADPFEQVVEAMARHLSEASSMDFATAWNFLYPPNGAFQAALDTGLLKLVEERPEMTVAQQIDEFAHPQEPRAAEKRQLAKERDYGAGHHPEDAACSDPNCSYRAEVSLLADECQGSGCRRRKAGHQPEGEPSEEQVDAAYNAMIESGYMKPGVGARDCVRVVLRIALAIDHPQDREAK